MTDLWFYHLEQRPLERVLPSLLERTLAKGWRAVVQVGNRERLGWLDTLLWTYDQGGFLPHSAVADEFAGDQPVFLTTEDDNPNEAQLRYLVDGAWSDDLEGYERVLLLFDGRDPALRDEARERWSEAKAAGHDVTYWQETASGKWEQKA